MGASCRFSGECEAYLAQRSAGWASDVLSERARRAQIPPNRLEIHRGLPKIYEDKINAPQWSGEHGVGMRIPRTVFDEMVDHAKKARPAECCGLLVGKGRLVTRIYRLDNEDGSPTSYRAAPQQQLHAFREMEDLGLDLLAIYHSHPDTESYPSPVDVEKAFISEALHMIISLREPTSQVRAFRITRGGEINEEKFEIL